MITCIIILKACFVERVGGKIAMLQRHNHVDRKEILNCVLKQGLIQVNHVAKKI